jgi:hypothetical protein
LLDYKHELVLLLVNTLLSDLKSDNFVVIATALVVTSKLIGADLINAGVCFGGGGGGGRDGGGRKEVFFLGGSE